MILPNATFDALMFGLLLLAAAHRQRVSNYTRRGEPAHRGRRDLLGGAGTERLCWCAASGWTQEALATSVALCVGGFLYFVLRNSSDLALLALSIGLMMGALMAAISIMSAVHSTFKEGSGTPLIGWVVTTVSALALGVTAGITAIVLGQASNSLLPLKIGGIVAAFVLWKLREKMAPPEVNPHFQEMTAQSSAPVPAPLTALRVALFPQRGTLLDRLFPLLVTGILLLAVVKNGAQVSLPAGAPVAASEEGEAR
jgi:hypothetical protein